jgi:pSer/pThr/pTyr-binding forkhead associated (FHA) protein
MSKICKHCTCLNDDAAIVCEVCGEALSGAATISRGRPTITLLLKSSTTARRIVIPEGGGIIGRNYYIAPEIFNHKWVSELHCRISVIDDECYIEDIGSDGMGSTNGTFINGNKLPPTVPVKFYDGDELNIAKYLLFNVKVEYPQIEMSDDSGDVETPEKLMWIVVCPVCGTEYTAESEDKGRDECEVCPDSMDKKRISKVKPKPKLEQVK